MIIHGITTTDRLLQEQDTNSRKIRTSMNNTDETFNNAVKRPVLFAENFDKRRITMAQEDITGNLRPGVRAMDDYEELYRNWGMNLVRNSADFMQKQEYGNSKKAILGKVGDKLRTQPEETPEAIENLIDDATFKTIASELVDLDNEGLDEDRIEEIIQSLGIEGDKDTQNIIHQLRSLSEHAHQDPINTARRIESSVEDVKGNIGRFTGIGEELAYGGTSRLTDAQEFIHTQSRLLVDTVDKADYMLNLGGKKANDMSTAFHRTKDQLREYFSRQSSTAKQ